MTRAAEFYTSRPFMTVCVIFSSIPFWVPLAAIFANGTDPFLMLLTAVMSCASGIFARSVNFEPFRLSPAYTFIRLFLFSLVFVMFAGYANLGEQTDKLLAALAIVVVFYFMFIRRSAGFGFTSSFMWLFKTFLWIGFLYGLGLGYALLAIAVHFMLFYRRYGRA